MVGIVAAAVAIAAVAIAAVGVAAADGCDRAGISPAGGAGSGSVAIISLTIVAAGRVGAGRTPDRIGIGIGHASRGATWGRGTVSEAVGDAMEVHPDFADRWGDADDAWPGGMCAGIPRRLA